MQTTNNVSEEKIRSVQDRIEKLLALNLNPGTPEEAMNAMDKVKFICDKYNLEINDYLGKARRDEPKSLISQFVSRKIGDAWVTKSNRTRMLHSVIISLYNVRVIDHRVFNPLGGNTLIQSNVVGFEVNVEASRLTFDYLEKELEKLVARAKKEKKIKGVRESTSYKMGALCKMYSIAEQIKKTGDQNCMALMLVTDKAYDEYFEQNQIKKGKKMKFSLDAKSYNNGYVDADGIDLTGATDKMTRGAPMIED